jgi:hypothetical protein
MGGLRTLSIIASVIAVVLPFPPRSAVKTLKHKKIKIMNQTNNSSTNYLLCCQQPQIERHYQLNLHIQVNQDVSTS